MLLTRRSISSIAILLLSMSTVSTVIADDDDERYENDRWQRVEVIRAEPATGPNRVLDKPVRDHGVVFGWPMGSLGFNELGIYNPDGDIAFPLTSDVSDDDVLATILDPDFVISLGFDPTDLDPSYLNVPIQKVKTLYERRVGGQISVGRESLPGMLEETTTPFKASIAGSTKPITVGDWLGAKGKMTVKCNGTNDQSEFEMKMSGLIPNRLYTVWSANVSESLGPFNQPLGGAPSAFVTDEKGRAKFKRKMNFCILDVVEEVRARMLWIMVLLHSDHMAYGGVFTPNSDSLFGGTVAHVQLHFPITGDQVE